MLNPESLTRAQSAATPEQVKAYQQDGAVCIRGLLTRDQIELLKTGIENNLKSPSPRAKVASLPDDPGFFIEDFCNWQDNSHYRKLIFESPLSAVAGFLMESQTSRLIMIIS